MALARSDTFARIKTIGTKGTMRRLAGLMLCVAAALSGCGGDDGGGTPTPTPTPTAAYAVGGTVSGLGGGGLVLKNGTETLAVAADGKFAFPTKLASGASYAITVDTQPAGQTCTVADGSGTIANADITTVAVTCAVSAGTLYAYAEVTHSQADSGGQIQYLAYDPATGRLALRGTFTMPDAQTYIGNVVPTVDGRKLIVSTFALIPPSHSETRQDLYLYDLSTATGAPSTSRLVVSPGYADFAHPNGQDLYSVGEILNAINQAGANHYSLTAGGQQGNSVSLGFGASDGMMSPDGKFLFVHAVEENGPLPQAFVDTISLADPAHPVLVGKTPITDPLANGAISPDGAYLYMTSAYTPFEPPVPGVVFKVDAGGGLTQVGTFPSPSAPRSVAIDLSGRFLYLSTGSDGTVERYRLDGGGRITKLGTTAVPDAEGLAFSPDGKYLYVVTAPNDLHASPGVIYGFIVRGNGTLGATRGSPYSTGERIGNLVFARPNG